jgi:hypothetical protein
MFGSSRDLFRELRSVIKQLGDHGGLISPSVYETAQVLRLYPPREGVVPGLEWLLSEQYEDGGWGVLTVPSTRDVPTLAAILALHMYRHEVAAEDAIQAGLAFLQRQAHQWQSVHIDLIPVACEMILPFLLEEAAKMGLVIDQAPYARLFKLRHIKLQHLEGKSLLPNSAPSLSWEALGLPYTPTILHPCTGVGHSPAATAAWLHAAKAAGEDAALCAKAENYLVRAAVTTATGIPGVVPMAYPITGFELCYGLYALLLTGLLNHPDLQDVVAPKIAMLRAMVEEEQGLGFGEGFVADVDDTAVAVAVLLAAKQDVDIQYVQHFWFGDHYYTFSHELNPSVFSNAHALHALVLCGEPSQLTEDFLIQQQMQSGAWVIDKWHTSWRSSTLEVVAALLPLGYEDQLCRAGEALIADQNEDGSWGVAHGDPLLETTYCVMALQLLASKPRFTARMLPAILQGRRWLRERLDRLDTVECAWICKEVFAPIRVDRLYKLGALLSPLFDKIGVADGRVAELASPTAHTQDKGV